MRRAYAQERAKLALDSSRALRLYFAPDTKVLMQGTHTAAPSQNGKGKSVSKDNKHNPQTKYGLIKLEPVINILRAAIWSGRIGDEKPVSVMLIAEQESAKTEALKFFRGTSSLVYLSDLTSRGMNAYKDDIQRGKLRHIVIMDLVRILSHGRGVSERTIQTLASLMEEGEGATSDAGGRSEWENFPNIGALMGITTSFFKARRGKWRQTGFLTRFVPVCFRYKETTITQIHKAIAMGMEKPKPHPEVLPQLPNIVHCEEKFSHQIGAKARELGQKMRTYGFRYHRVLRTLAKANARLNNRAAVKQEDIDLVLEEWAQFFTDKEVEL